MEKSNCVYVQASDIESLTSEDIKLKEGKKFWHIETTVVKDESQDAGKELYEQAFDLVERIFKDCDPELKHHITFNSDDVVLSMPDVFAKFLAEGHKKTLGVSAYNSAGKLKYRNVTIIPNYNMEVVLYHRSYPKLPQPWMIHKVKLNSFPNI